MGAGAVHPPRWYSLRYRLLSAAAIVHQVPPGLLVDGRDAGASGRQVVPAFGRGDRCRALSVRLPICHEQRGGSLCLRRQRDVATMATSIRLMRCSASAGQVGV